MPNRFEVKLDSKTKKLIQDGGLIAEVKKTFSKGKSTAKIKRAIVQDLIRGVSPVNGKGKFIKYSDSYKDVIRNKAAYRTINGKVVRYSSDFLKGLTQKDVKVAAGSAERSKKLIGQLKTSRANAKKLVADLNRDFHRASNPTKRVSPVNLRHTGGLHKSLRVFTKGGFASAYRMVIQFRNKLADIHDRRGAGKKKVVRRMLPTRSGERFNRRINDVIITELKNAVNLVVKTLS